MLPSALAAGLCAFLAASVYCWAILIRRLAARHPFLPQESAVFAPWGFVDLLVAVVFLSSCELLALTYVRTGLGIEPDSPLNQWDVETQAAFLGPHSFARLAAIVLVMAWLGARYRLAFRELGWGIGRSSCEAGVDSPSESDQISVHRSCEWLLGLAAVRRDVVIGTVAFVAVAPVVFGIHWLLLQFVESKHPVLELLKANPAPRFFVLSVISAVLVAPVVEEFMFRVLLQGWIERFATFPLEPLRIVLGGRGGVGAPSPAPLQNGNGKRLTERESRDPDGGSESFDRFGFFPILASSALFALMHLSHGPTPVPLFVFAVVLGYVYARTRRILPCIVTHALLNAVSLSGLWLTIHFNLG